MYPVTQFLHCYFQNKSTFLNLVSQLFWEEAEASPQEVQPNYTALAIWQLRKTSGGSRGREARFLRVGRGLRGVRLQTSPQVSTQAAPWQLGSGTLTSP